MKQTGQQRIQTLGHRGAGNLEPENTLRSIRRAIELGMAAVEFDIRKCRSGELVVIHDASVNRTTDGKGLVADLTLAQLKELDAGKGEKIPTLKEIFELCKNKVTMCIELKEKGLEDDVVEQISKSGVADNVVIISFYHESIKRVKQLAAAKKIKLKTGALLMGNPLNIVAIAKAADADAISMYQGFADERIVNELKAANINVTVWTCNTEQDIKRMQALGVDVIATDEPDLLLKVLR